MSAILDYQSEDLRVALIVDKEKLDFLYEEAKARKERDETENLSTSEASSGKRQKIAAATGLRVTLGLVPIPNAAKVQRIKEEFDAAGKRWAAAAKEQEERAAAAMEGEQQTAEGEQQKASGDQKEEAPTGIRRFEWMGQEDSAQEMERMTLRLRALIGWDKFPPALELHDIHTQSLFNVHIGGSLKHYDIVSKADMCLRHAKVGQGGLILDDVLMLIKLKKDLAPDALQSKAEAQAYLQYVALHKSTGRHAPVLLTEGNINIIFIYNPRLKVVQKLYWGFEDITAAAIYLGDLVKRLDAESSVAPGYDPVEDDLHGPQGDVCMREPEPNFEHLPEEPSVKAGPSSTPPSLFSSDSPCHQPSVHDSEGRDAELQEALRLASYHPMVTAEFGIPPYPKPLSYDIPLHS
ncbi:hypothetical protein COCOBI_08-5280 [Coccomyxa sp. Obi]|nr:hypothetical protein COCOBI_08-5280 [Coccomyxa sp. Obi]